MNKITFIILVTIAVLIVATFIIIPVTKLLFNVAVTVVPFLIAVVGAYFVYQHLLNRKKQ